jgi:hypothetical protein
MTEGTAVAFTEGLADRQAAHTKTAGALAADSLPPATRFMAPDGFHAVNEGNAYDAAGSFLGFLVLEHGIEAFVQLQRSFDWEGVYGADLAGLDARWRAFLAEVPVDLEQRARARDQFDPKLRPAYLDAQCPKLGSRAESLQERAERLLAHGDAEAALDVYLQLLEDSGKVRWALRAASCLDRLGRGEELVALLQQRLADPNLGEDGRFQLLDRQLRPLVELERWEEVQATLAALRRLEPFPAPEQRALARIVSEPTLREGVAAFFRQGTSRGRQTLLELTAANPEDDALAVVVATRLSTLPDDERDLLLTARDQARIDEALGFLARAPEACDALAPDLIELAHHAVRLRELELAERLAARVVAECTRTLPVLEADRIRERVAWERTHPMPEIRERR